MVAVDRLEQYDEAERQLARERAPLAAPNGFIADMAPVFDHDSSDRIAVMRAGAPLSALIIFYRQTVVFVPPASVANLERRFAMTWDALLTLSDAGIVLPVGGNPVEYANKRHFGDLFDYRPPSVWSRGDELARRFAGGTILAIISQCWYSWAGWLSRRTLSFYCASLTN